MQGLSIRCLSFVLLAQFTTVGTAIAQAGSDKPQIQTSASATRSVPANQATLTLQFTAEDSTPALAGRRLALRADSVRRTLTALGIPRDSLITASRWSWGSDRMQSFTSPRCLTPALPGHTCVQVQDSTFVNSRVTWTRPVYDTLYRAREVIEVHAGDPALVGTVIDSALALRITEISNIRFMATDVRGAQLAALEEATGRARQQGEVIAAASGGRLGKVISLSTSEDEGRYSGGLRMVEVTASSVSGSTQVTAPVVPVTVTVYARWEFVRR